ncbi:metalloregulator ArsR/SmtB family transcription factor [Vibrio sp. SCSIO 43136]|uniref:ArsR/SmtB family transcription factor n=1 Tax=Vibrio sp. SCSIO 43136 TaxID=2819101 RepID=UPI0020750E37|nr:metalloregulator ArsR/SmtB family transcription factor [Vibrio sp. SCSIO 43136]USD68215.1 helix-turn-helix transcriptional regulator [Vibrio sp. SCSIO 43136]
MDLISMKENATQVSEILRILSHPERLMVLCQLIDKEVGAGELQANSSLGQSAFSQHLTVLRNHKLVDVRKESQQVFYRLADPRIEQLIENLHALFCQQAKKF